MITYPLTPPSTPGPNSLVITASNITAISQSPYTGETQVQEWPGEYLTLDVSLPPMKRAAAEQWISFLVALRGMVGTFLYGDASNKSFFGAAVGASPVVDGDQLAASKLLTVSNLPINTPGAFKAGAYFQLGTGGNAHLHKVLTDADTDASGITTLDIFPRLRAAVSDGDSVVITNPVGLFRLTGNDSKWSISEALNYGIQFQAVEALGSGEEETPGS